jgi:hypothetical protein
MEQKAEKMTRFVRVRMRERQRLKLETIAELQGLQVSDVVRLACNQYVMKFSVQPNEIIQTR